MTKKPSQQHISFLQKFWLPIILAIITLVGTIVTIISPELIKRISPTATMPPPNTFDYQVHVETNAGEPIANASVIIEIGGGKVPLDTVSDSTGLARIIIETSYVGKPGRLLVSAIGYKIHTQNIDLTEGSLPKVIQLIPAP